jgi:hypothetical protein
MKTTHQSTCPKNLSRREQRNLQMALKYIQNEILFRKGTLHDMQQRIMEATEFWQKRGKLSDGIDLPVSLSTQIESYSDQRYIDKQLPSLVFRDYSLNDHKEFSDHASHMLVLKLYSWVIATIHRTQTGASQVQADSHVQNHLYFLRRDLVQFIDISHDTFHDFVEHDHGGDCILGSVAAEIFGMALMINGNAFKFSVNRTSETTKMDSVDHRSMLFGSKDNLPRNTISRESFLPSFCKFDWSNQPVSVNTIERIKNRIFEAVSSESTLWTPNEVVHKIFNIYDPELGNVIAIFVSRFHLDKKRSSDDLLDLIVLRP